MDIIDRSEAIEKFTAETLSSLNQEKRECQLLNWWGIDPSNPDFLSLSEDPRKTIIAHDDLPDDIENSKYNELIQLALRPEHKRAKNSYLAKNLIH
ncbi:hypothetical protein PS925_00365 [Pseudomonas fluorescens]|uniref:Uncharacterized protein n=1 Tax=Pseudomonas fluorescens TaxID=294 RepID=A0A5E7S940_PSEFL|nr:hypothetical protein [Pseudomonas fluorescens]VVP79683.1 hypothetical protein PS925_00365 [Pseudomonas fluorescens]